MKKKKRGVRTTRDTDWKPGISRMRATSIGMVCGCIPDARMVGELEFRKRKVSLTYLEKILVEKLDVSICHIFLLGMEDCIFKWSNAYIVLQSLIFKLCQA